MSTGARPAADAGASGDGGRRERRERALGARGGAPTWQPVAPTTETLEVLRRRLPLSIRLIGRSSVPGALLVLAVAAVFIGIVPLAAKLQLNASQATGDVIQVGNAFELTVANDWSVESQDGRATVLASGSSRLVIVPAYEDSRSVTQVVAAEISSVDADGTGSWVVGEPTTFETDLGDQGATVSASSETSATQVWAVSRDGLTTVAVLSTTIESWTSAQPLVQDMIDSIEFSAGQGATREAEAGP
ncbi:hypothetical protein [Demequina aestuarii]|uniref:hypothetical protein n=1 Tax=Demequina aestuarii TaxID=327095 RepID=UPI00078673D5|nr:hypothetical protein [Demequina aestuarii]